MSQSNAVRSEEHTHTPATSTPEGGTVHQLTDVLYSHADALQQAIDAGDVTKQEILKAMDWKGPLLSMYLNKNYHVNTKVSHDTVKAHNQKIGDYLRRLRLRQTAEGERPFFPTSHAQRLTDYLDLCFTLRKMRVVLGGTGLGKTETFLRYQQQHNRIYHLEIEPSSSRNEERPVVEQLYATVFGDDMPTSLWTRKAKAMIYKELKGKDCLLIVDEAQELTFQQFASFRFLYDKCKIGILLCQQSDAKDSPGYDRTQHYFRNPQFLRRIGGQTWNLNDQPITRADVALIAEYYGITDAGAIKWMADRVNTPVTRYGWLMELMQMGRLMADYDMNDMNSLKMIHRKLREGR